MSLNNFFSNIETSTQLNEVTSVSAANIEQYNNMLTQKSEDFWIKKGEEKALNLFHEASLRIPAYKSFLKERNFNPKHIKTIEDFKKVPLTNKENYINRYGLKEKCWDGSLDNMSLVASSSGTTGQRLFWPRGTYQELESAIIHELIFSYLFSVKKEKTLIIICFPMGVYVSGIATLLPSWLVSTKTNNISCISAGNNKKDVLKVIKNLSKEYQKVIIIGHPFFVKDVIETGEREKIIWNKINLQIMFCSGAFDESWRKYLMNKTGIKNSYDMLNTYGCTEMLLIGNETPLTIFTRTFLNERGLIQTIFDKEKKYNTLPNVFQYNPLMRYIETVDGELIFTSASGIPLIRFNLHDLGQVVNFSTVKEKLSGVDDSWEKKFRQFQKIEKPLWKLPFVCLYGRSDYTVKFFAANIYPEHIQAALSQKKFFKKITGKFVLSKHLNKKKDEFLVVNIELCSTTINQNLKPILEDEIERKLLNLNNEFKDAQHHANKKIKPKVKLWPYNHSKFFKPGLKPKFIY